MDRLRGTELADSLVEVRKVLQEIRTLNTSGELGKVRGSRRAVVFYVDQGTGFLAYLRWWLYAWRLAGLDTPQQAMDVILFTHPASVARLPADCVRVTEEFDPEAAGPGQCLYRELVPLSERNAKYDSYLNSQECMFNADTSGFLLRYKLLLRADLDTFPTPALVDFWPWDIICDTHAVTNHYLHSIEDAIVDTAAAAGTNIMWACGNVNDKTFHLGRYIPKIVPPQLKIHCIVDPTLHLWGRYPAPRLVQHGLGVAGAQPAPGDAVQADGAARQVHPRPHVRAGHRVPLRHVHAAAGHVSVGRRPVRGHAAALRAGDRAERDVDAAGARLRGPAPRLPGRVHHQARHQHLPRGAAARQTQPQHLQQSNPTHLMLAILTSRL